MKHGIVYYGSEILTRKAEDVNEFTPDIPELVTEMFTVLEQAKGIGLAAPQIGISKNIIVVDVSHYKDGPKVGLINPVIVWDSADEQVYEEGCLSVPGLFTEVIRPGKVKVQAYSPEGKRLEFSADGIFARVLQHEIDHLNGILFIDRIDDAVRKEFSKELKQIKKMNKRK
ncbi:MAG TPA: peptide deformylase [Spirochaetota bacterium]|nr:peptide deformylase [Spirochaetota bacterium]